MSSIALLWPKARTYATITDNTLGTCIPTFSVQATATGGMFCESWEVPPDFDRSRPAYLDWFLFRQAGILINGADVVTAVAVTVSPKDQTPVETTWSIVTPIPTNWPNQVRIDLELLNAGTPAFPAHSIPDNSWFSVRAWRDGPNVLDTYPVPISYPNGLILRYNRLCQFCDGCC